MAEENKTINQETKKEPETKKGGSKLGKIAMGAALVGGGWLLKTGWDCLTKD